MNDKTSTALANPDSGGTEAGSDDALDLDLVRFVANGANYYGHTEVSRGPADPEWVAWREALEKLQALLKKAPPARIPTAPVETGGWQPIETAPVDGTAIDLWSPSEFGGSRWTDCYWGKPQHSCGEAGPYCDSDWHGAEPAWVDGTFQDFLHVKPTHWMPIPASPASEVKGKEKA